MKNLRTLLLTVLSVVVCLPAVAQEEIAPVIITMDPDLSRDLVAYPSTAPVTPFVAEVFARTTNRFIGTATMRYTRTYHGTTTNWTVKYASTADSMVLISHSDEPLPSVRTQAYIVDRTRNNEVYYTLTAVDSMVKHWSRQLPVEPHADLFLADTLGSGTRVIEGRTCVQRGHHGTMFKRTIWLAPTIPSPFLDLLSVREAWYGMDHIITAYHLTPAAEGMPLFVEFSSNDEGDRYTLRVLDIELGAVHPELFTITKHSWDF